MANSNVNIRGGIGFPGLLTIVFIILKLTESIAWSWWWVVSPMIISTGIWITIAVIVFIIALIVALKG